MKKYLDAFITYAVILLMAEGFEYFTAIDEQQFLICYILLLVIKWDCERD